MGIREKLEKELEEWDVKRQEAEKRLGNAEFSNFGWYSFGVRV